MLTQRRSSCLSFAFVGKFSCLIFSLHKSLWQITRFLLLEFGTYSINAMHPKTRKILQLLRLRQVLHETHPLWYYIAVSGYYGFYFCLGHETQTICLLYCVFVYRLAVLLFLSYLGLRSLSHSLEFFEAKLNPLVSRCKHVLFLTFRSLYKYYVYTISNRVTVEQFVTLSPML